MNVSLFFVLGVAVLMIGAITAEADAQLFPQYFPSGAQSQCSGAVGKSDNLTKSNLELNDSGLNNANETAIKAQTYNNNNTDFGDQLAVASAHSSTNNSSSNKPVEVEGVGGTIYVLESNGLRYGADSPWDEFYHVEILYPNGTLIWNNTQHWVNQIKYCTDTTTPIQDKVASNTPDCSKPIAAVFGITNMGSIAEALKHMTVIVKCPGTPQQHLLRMNVLSKHLILDSGTDIIG